MTKFLRVGNVLVRKAAIRAVQAKAIWSTQDNAYCIKVQVGANEQDVVSTVVQGHEAVDLTLAYMERALNAQRRRR